VQGRADRRGERVFSVAEVEAAEDGDPQRSETIPQHVEKGPASIAVIVEAGKAAQRDPVKAAQCP
jgi:hypothetical protein